MTQAAPDQPHRPQKYRPEVLAVLTALLADRADTSPRTMFGYPGFAVGGKVFASCFNDGVAFKLPPALVQSVLARPDAEPFRPGGKAMREWVHIVRDDPEAYADDLDLLHAAIEYVASLAARR
jgi:hypothetical protein